MIIIVRCVDVFASGTHLEGAEHVRYGTSGQAVRPLRGRNRWPSAERHGPIKHG